ncbi:MAG: DUF1330 domain-containing protein [Gemmatimonadetes bacterium]|nr:DUF1330 domain-containing protein [Gemmatimonadota bacterium]
MAAYVLAQITVHDPVTYERYKALSGAALEPYGGRFLVRGGAVETMEGTWQPARLVVIEFPDAAAARAWWASPEYAEARALRQASAHTELLLAPGV